MKKLGIFLLLLSFTSVMIGCGEKGGDTPAETVTETEEAVEGADGGTVEEVEVTEEEGTDG